jgi:hypothetical protein
MDDHMIKIGFKYTAENIEITHPGITSSQSIRENSGLQSTTQTNSTYEIKPTAPIKALPA